MSEVIDNKKGIFYSICFMMFIDSLGAGLIYPILPQLFFNDQLKFITHFSISPAHLYGLALGLFPLTQFLGVSFFGVMSDYYSKRWLIISGLFVLIVGYIISVIAILERNLILFLFCRALGGFSSGIFSIGYALIAGGGVQTNSVANDRFDSFKLRSLSDKLGLVIGPGLSIFVVSNPYFKNPLIIPYLIAFILGILNLCVIWYNTRNFLSENTISSSPQKKSFKWSSLFNASYRALKDKRTRLLILSFIVFQCGASLFIQGLSLYLTINYNFTPQDIGIFFVAMGSLIILSLFGLVQFLSPYLDFTEQVKFMLLTVLAIFLFGISQKFFDVPSFFSSPIIKIWIISGFFYLMLPIARVGFATLFSTSVNSDEQGWIMGALGQISAFTYSVSALLSGYLVLHQDILLISTFYLFFSLLMLRIYLKYWNPQTGEK